MFAERGEPDLESGAESSTGLGGTSSSCIPTSVASSRLLGLCAVCTFGTWHLSKEFSTVDCGPFDNCTRLVYQPSSPLEHLPSLLGAGAIRWRSGMRGSRTSGIC